MDWYKQFWRPMLFRLSADRAHAVTQRVLRSRLPTALLGRSSRFEDPRLATDLAGIPLANPIGLAPGLDKNGNLIKGLDQLGFGYLVIGSVTTEPRRGNPKPRMVRYPDRKSIGNSLGLPSLGLPAVLDILGSREPTRSRILVSVAGFSSEELISAAAAIEPHADGVEIGLICPNTTESERMEEIAIFTDLTQGLTEVVSKPVFIKLPPHHDRREREQVVKMLDVCVEFGIAGVSVSGGRTVQEPRLATGSGSLNGRDTHQDALRITAEVAAHTEGKLAIKASGGIFDAEDAAHMLEAGATTTELYTSLVYEGWRIAGSLKRGLIRLMDEAGIQEVGSLVGRPHRADDTSS